MNPKIKGQSKWAVNPLLIFIFSLTALVASLFLFIHWHLKLNEDFQIFLSKYNLNSTTFYQTETWVEILVLSLLVSIILLGLAIIYIYYYKLVKLYRYQQNFINGFTHELKTPIASLKLYLETFIRHELPRDEELKYLDFMQRDVQRLSDNVQKILDLSYLENKNRITDFRNTDIQKFIKDIIEKNSHQFKNTHISFDFDHSQEYLIKINPSLFEILVTNLLNNCVVHNQNNKPIINIYIEKNNDRIQLKIRDNGKRIDPNQLKDIFKKFYRGEQTAKGNGLGLYLVNLIAKLHKGKIWAENLESEEGAQFILEFPEGRHS